MGKKVGLWIDHRQAIIVSITEEEGEEIGLITSQAEKQLRRSGDSPLKGPYESHSKCRKMTAAREPLRDISTFTTMR